MIIKKALNFRLRYLKKLSNTSLFCKMFMNHFFVSTWIE